MKFCTKEEKETKITLEQEENEIELWAENEGTSEHILTLRENGTITLMYIGKTNAKKLGLELDDEGYIEIENRD